jgi:DNA-binding response OmpR family regulator
MTRGRLAWVVAPPGRLNDGWRALLLATPQIADVRQVYDVFSVLGQAETPVPDLVLLDAEPLGERAWDVLNQLKVKCAQCCCIVLACSARQRQQALDAGADEALIKGFPAGRLSTVVERLLSRPSGNVP